MPAQSTRAEWMVSLHGGHSSEYCDHATSTLQEVLDAAVAGGFHTYGITEHAPRQEARFLYPEEIAMGWDVATLARKFEDYAAATRAFVAEYADRMTVLRGFEAEVVPAGRYAEVMLDYRKQFGFDYLVGSVHYVDDRLFDGRAAQFHEIVDSLGGFEPFVVQYYRDVADMVEALQPEVVAHLDLYRKFGRDLGPTDTPAMQRSAASALEALKRHDCILDINVAAYRKGLDTPYPEPWLVRMARDMGIGMCFGDDSHCAADVGAHLAEGREYLLAHDIRRLTVLTKDHGALVKRAIPLE
jgi:histidinol-phosphatase (PHP family)